MLTISLRPFVSLLTFISRGAFKQTTPFVKHGHSKKRHGHDHEYSIRYRPSAKYHGSHAMVLRGSNPSEMAEGSNPGFLKTINNVNYDTFSDNASRREALAHANALVRRLQHPIEAVWDVALLYPALLSALKVSIDLDIFTKLDADHERRKTTQELAGAGDSVVLKRTLRHLAAMNFIDEVDEDLWRTTRISSAMRQAQVYAHVDFAHDSGQAAFTGLASWLKHIEYQNPENAMKGNWQNVTSSDKTFFEWLSQRPREQQTFWDLMDGVASQPGSWTDVYPVDTIFQLNDVNGSFIVDVGGAEGRDMQSFVRQHPKSWGRVVLQDQPAVIHTVQHLRQQGVIPMAHDFFSEQPVKGARIYYIHRVLHDWPDDKAREILSYLKPAFLKGHSRLIINEVVLPKSGATADQTGLDLTMMALVSGRERTEEQWKALVESAGFKVLHIYHSLASKEAVIEAELA